MEAIITTNTKFNRTYIFLSIFLLTVNTINNDAAMPHITKNSINFHPCLVAVIQLVINISFPPSNILLIL